MNVDSRGLRDTIVSALEAAERTRLAVPPLTESYPWLSPSDAYAVQAEWLERKLSAGGQVIGRKVGLTSRAMQQQLGVNEPDFGFLLDRMVVASGAELRRAELLQPRVEPEIAFWLAADLHGSASPW
jgi:2-keto-4-pentenoate hydratase